LWRWHRSRARGTGSSEHWARRVVGRECSGTGRQCAGWGQQEAWQQVRLGAAAVAAGGGHVSGRHESCVLASSASAVGTVEKERTTHDIKRTCLIVCLVYILRIVWQSVACQCCLPSVLAAQVSGLRHTKFHSHARHTVRAFIGMITLKMKRYQLLHSVHAKRWLGRMVTEYRTSTCA
jgi:hypothetical protein